MNSWPMPAKRLFDSIRRYFLVESSAIRALAASQNLMCVRGFANPIYKRLRGLIYASGK
jgi:hypothetical protein